MISGNAFLGSFAAAGSHFWFAYISLIVAGGAIYAPYGPVFAIVPEMLARHVAEEVMALINTFGALGDFAGTWSLGWRQVLTGNSRAGASYPHRLR